MLEVVECFRTSHVLNINYQFESVEGIFLLNTFSVTGSLSSIFPLNLRMDRQTRKGGKASGMFMSI